MARDFENLRDIENLDDGELRDLIAEELNGYPDLDAESIDIRVEAGAVLLAGRVGTEQELQQIEQVVTDVIGVERFRNDLVIDELMRATTSEAADEAAAQAGLDQPMLGNRTGTTEDSASHLVEDVAAELYGTQDMQQAIQDGLSYEPPDKPIQQGTRNREDH